MAQSENEYALTSLERVKEHARISTTNHDAELLRLINEVSSRVERYCGRHFLSRQYVHDGTTLPRLTSYGGSVLVLPQRPITAVSALTLYPDGSSLTEGYNSDFMVEGGPGIIRLIGQVFAGSTDLPAVGYVELTYTAGYTVADGEDTDWDWASSHAGAEIGLAVAMQVAEVWHGKDRQRDGLASVSTEGTTATYLNRPWLPAVQEILDAHRRIATCL